MINKYTDFINESVRDKMIPKSPEEIKEISKNVSAKRLMEISVYHTHNLEGVKEALKRGFDPSENNNNFLEGMIMTDHYNSVMIDLINDRGGILSDLSELTNRWFVCNCLEEDDEEQERLFNFYREVLKIFLSDGRVLKNMNAMEILGYRTLLGLR